MKRSRLQNTTSLKVAVKLMDAGHTEWIGNDKSASRQMSTAPWHEPPTTVPGPSETLIEEVCGGIALAGIDRERRRVAGLFFGPWEAAHSERVQQGSASGLG
jgi:hypothetical protein